MYTLLNERAHAATWGGGGAAGLAGDDHRYRLLKQLVLLLRLCGCAGGYARRCTTIDLLKFEERDCLFVCLFVFEHQLHICYISRQAGKQVCSRDVANRFSKNKKRESKNIFKKQDARSEMRNAKKRENSRKCEIGHFWVEFQQFSNHCLESQNFEKRKIFCFVTIQIIFRK